MNNKEKLKPLIKVLLSTNLTFVFEELAKEYLNPEYVIPLNGSAEHIYGILLLAVDDAKLNKPSSNNSIYLAFYNLAIEILEEIPINDSSI